MKKRLFFYLCMFLLLAAPARAVCPCQSETVPGVLTPTAADQAEGNLFLYNDEDMSASRSEFYVLETVFVQIRSGNNGDLKRELKILNSAQKELSQLPLQRVGAKPYLYTASFLAPEPPGIYGLEVQLEDETGVFSTRRNFRVIGGSTSPTPEVSLPDQSETQNLFSLIKQAAESFLRAVWRCLDFSKP